MSGVLAYHRPKLLLRPISRAESRRLIAAHHYAVTSPSSVTLHLGVIAHEGSPVGVIQLGYGVRPLHTIRALFPSLTPIDYLEICRFYLDDSLLHGSESYVIAQVRRFVSKHYPRVKLLFTWADGLRGKPGYIYQASNFLYGGFIESEFYVTAEGEVVHPRLIIGRLGSRSAMVTTAHGLTKLHGRQFRYVSFLCSHKERKRLLAESTVIWEQQYPKVVDCIWWVQAGEGARESRELPKLKGTGQFRQPAPMFQWMQGE